MKTPTLMTTALSLFSALMLSSLPSASLSAEPCDLDLATLGAPTLRCQLHEADPLVSALDGAAVPGRLNFQARLSQAKLLLGDRNLPQIVVRIQDLKGQTLCGMERSDVVVDDSVLNLELKEEALGGCKLGPLLARHAQLKVQVCFGQQNCLRPLKLSTVPYALKSEYSYWALRAERVEQASVSHYSARISADRDLLNTARRALDQNLTGEFVVDASAPASLNHPETGSSYEVNSQVEDGTLLWSPASTAGTKLYIASKDHQRDAIRRLNRLSFVAQKGLIAGHLTIDGIPQGERRAGLQLVQGDLYLKNPLSVSERLLVRGAELNHEHPLPLNELSRQVESDLSPSALERQYALSISDHNSPSASSRELRLQVEGDSAIQGALWLGQSLTVHSGLSVIGAGLIEGRLNTGELSVRGEGRLTNPSFALATGPMNTPSLELSELTVGPSIDQSPTPLLLTRGDLKVAAEVSVTGDSQLKRSLSIAEGSSFATERLIMQVRENQGGGDLSPAQQSEILASEGNTLYLNGDETKMIIRGETRIMGEVEFRQPPVLSGGCRIQVPADQQGLAISQVERFSLVCGEQSVTLRPYRCGNNVIDPGEQCDQGDVRDGDGCSSHCLCEPENLIDGVYYPPDDITKPLIPCSGDSCGNGTIDPGEDCDDPRDTSCIGCRRVICGDGVLGAGESCDDGNTNNNDGCSSTCEFERQLLSAVEDTDLHFSVLDNLTDSSGRDLNYDCAVAGQNQMTKAEFVGVGVDVLTKTSGVLRAPTYTNNVTYSPKLNENGVDSFVCVVSPEGGDETDHRLLNVRVVIDAVNDAPVATDSTGTTPEETLVALTPTISDVDAGDTLTVTVTSASNGSATVGANNVISYTPELNFVGDATITFQVADADGLTDTATITVTVTNVNDAPVATDSTGTTPEETLVALTPTISDVDAGDTLTVTVTSASNGSATVGANNVISYTPELNFVGDATITFQVADADGLTDTATMTVTVTNVNDAPVATDSTGTTPEETLVALTPTISDVDAGDTLTVTVTSASNGSATVGANNVISYTPELNFVGDATITFQVADADGLTDTATITVTVTNVNDAPVATDSTGTTPEETLVALTPTISDVDAGDTLTVTVTSASNGSATVGANNVISYTPELNFVGDATITFQVADADGLTDTATITVTVTNVNDAPVATDSTGTSPEETLVALTPTISDVDAGDTLTVTVTSASNGSATVGANNVISYTPELNFVGDATITFQVADADGLTDTATITVTVTNVNDAPVATDSTGTSPEETLVALTPTISDVDAGDTLTVTVTSASNGSATVGANNVISYTPELNFVGDATITFQVADADGLTDTATITVTVTNVNDAPVANADTLNAVTATPATVNVIANDNDVDDGDIISLVSCTDPSNGTVSEDIATGEVTYTSNAAFDGADSFNCTIKDTSDAQSIATVTVTVTP